MAGNYTDLPDYRQEYDRDGSAGVYIDGANVITQFTGAQLQELNDEDTGSIAALGGHGSVRRLAIIFPELRDIVAYFIAWSATGGSNMFPGILDKSADTTNGLDGTWTTVVNPYVVSTADAGAAKPYYRNAIQTISALGVKAMRFNQTFGGSGALLHAMHLYGHITTGQTKYLTLWRPSTAAGSEPTGDAAAGAAHFDWGNVPRSSSADRKFRLKNQHASLTANGVVVSIEALTDETPSFPGMHLFSTDGVTFTSTINIGNLAPGALSGDLWIRRTMPADADLGLWSARIVADATSWS